MDSSLRIAVGDLLGGHTVESDRLEFKASWEPSRVGPQVLRTICAFANDLHNLGGGYIVIGVEEQDGRAVLPPKGISERDLDLAQRWIQGQCRTIAPPLQPVVSPEFVDGQRVLVIWVPASQRGPHRAKKSKKGEYRYWIRAGSSTVDAAMTGQLDELLRHTALIPWDDRTATQAQLDDLSESIVREFLREIRSNLPRSLAADDLYRRMQISASVNGIKAPRNVGLLFFSLDPGAWFRAAKIEVVQFAGDRAGSVQEERSFTGPLAKQLRECLRYLETLSVSHLQKERGRANVRGWVSYPVEALRECLVNAVYHRSYERGQLEPTKVYLFPDRVEITSYPGPVAGVQREHLKPGARPRNVPARNRRIGEFLKELKLAEMRLSGLPKVYEVMRANGSAQPQFEFDEERTYFQVTLPAHPEYAAISAVRDAAHLRQVGEPREADKRVEDAWQSNPSSASLTAEMISILVERGDVSDAERVLDQFEQHGPVAAQAHVQNTLIKALLDGGFPDRAEHWLQRERPRMGERDAIDAAILARRARTDQLAHRYFELAGDAVYTDSRALLDFATTKIALANAAYRNRNQSSNRRFLKEARRLLERVIQIDSPAIRRAWAWRHLALTKSWQQRPHSEVVEAFQNAIHLAPEEARFREELTQYQKRVSGAA